MKHINVLLFILFVLCFGLQAQEKVSLSGYVKDEGNNPVAVAAIAVDNTTVGTYSEDNGFYELKLKPGTYTLLVSSIGYDTEKQEISLNTDKRVDFVLKNGTVDLGSVEVLGKTKSQKLKEGAFAVNALDVKSLANSVNNISSVVNKTTGIRIREEGGLGSDFELSINGMSGNSVRYFIDGIPLDSKGSGVSLANLPVNLIDRVEIYKGVVPSSLGADALGGAVNIITKEEKKNYADISYGIGSFHTHKADLNAQYVERKTGLLIRPTIGVNYSKNDYMMKGVEVWDEDSRKYVYFISQTPDP